MRLIEKLSDMENKWRAAIGAYQMFLKYNVVNCIKQHYNLQTENFPGGGNR